MKNTTRSFIAGILVTLSVLGVIGAAAAASQQTATLDYADIKITLDGQTVTPTDANGTAVEPFAISGTTYLPVRAVANALGLEVTWDSATSTVVLTTPESEKSVYITRTGEKYHYDSNCNGGTLLGCTP